MELSLLGCISTEPEISTGLSTLVSLLPTPLPDYGSKRFHHFCMHPWPEVDQPMRYNSKLMNSIWGRYNEHSVHNFKSLQCGSMQAAALGSASALTANEAAGQTMIQPPSPTLKGRWASLPPFISCHFILTAPHNVLFCVSLITWACSFSLRLFPHHPLHSVFHIHFSGPFPRGHLMCTLLISFFGLPLFYFPRPLS